MADLADKIRQAMREEMSGYHERWRAAINSVLEDHAEFPDGWCVNCGRSYPCVTLQHVGAALGVREDGE
jgi:hypothetical protein